MTPEPARLTLTGQVPVVHISKPDELVEESRRRRWIFGVVGVVAAAIDLVAGVAGGSGSHGASMALVEQLGVP